MSVCPLKSLLGGLEGWNFGWWLLATYGNDSVSHESSMTHFESSWLIFLFGEGVFGRNSFCAILKTDFWKESTTAKNRRCSEKPPNRWQPANSEETRQIGGNPPNFFENCQIFRKTFVSRFKGNLPFPQKWNGRVSAEETEHFHPCWSYMSKA